MLMFITNYTVALIVMKSLDTCYVVFLVYLAMPCLNYCMGYAKVHVISWRTCCIQKIYIMWNINESCDDCNIFIQLGLTERKKLKFASESEIKE